MDYTSHWDSRLMYGSIMAPKIGLVSVIIDKKKFFKNSDGKQFHKYQQNNKLSLTPNNLTPK